MALLVLGLVAAGPASAVTLDFRALCDSDYLADLGEEQFFVDVEEVDSDTVNFTFRNTGPKPSSIKLIYFDESNLTFDSLIEGPTVDFNVGATPNLFPCSCELDPVFTTDSSFERSCFWTGIGPDEWLTIVMNLDGGATFGDVLADLTGPDLRIGLVGKGICSWKTCCYVNNPIPVPGAVWLLGSGVLGLAGLRRRLSA